MFDLRKVRSAVSALPYVRRETPRFNLPPSSVRTRLFESVRDALGESDELQLMFPGSRGPHFKALNWTLKLGSAFCGEEL